MRRPALFGGPTKRTHCAQWAYMSCQRCFRFPLCRLCASCFAALAAATERRCPLKLFRRSTQAFGHLSDGPTAPCANRPTVAGSSGRLPERCPTAGRSRDGRRVRRSVARGLRGLEHVRHQSVELRRDNPTRSGVGRFDKRLGKGGGFYSKRSVAVNARLQTKQRPARKWSGL